MKYGGWCSYWKLLRKLTGKRVKRKDKYSVTEGMQSGEGLGSSPEGQLTVNSEVAVSW